MKTTIDMAREAGIEFQHITGILGKETISTMGSQRLERIEQLVALVRADEREKWAKFCETNQVWVGKGKRGFSKWGEDDFVTGGIHQGMDYAAAIRAGGNT
jgi:hypothetical protein